MKVFDVVRSARPRIEPLDAHRRRELRERLFALDDATAPPTPTRSPSGAVVSTAAPGARARAIAAPSRARSIARAVGGLVVVGLVVALAVVVATRDRLSPATAGVAATRPVGTDAPPATAAPAPRRTGVSRTASVVLPPTLLGLDEVSVTRAGPGSGAALLAGPAGATVWIAEVDGAPAPVDGLEVRDVGGLRVAFDPAADPAAGRLYRLVVPCGVVLVADAPGRDLLRPELVALLEAMTVSPSGVVELGDVAGWSTIDGGPSVDAYVSTVRAPVSGSEVPVRLEQLPGGAISQMTLGGRQLEEITFLGGRAWLDRTEPASGVTSVFWRDGATAFNVRGDGLDVAALADFVATLEPATPESWLQRFGATAPVAPPAAPACEPQPTLGRSLDP